MSAPTADDSEAHPSQPPQALPHHDAGASPRIDKPRIVATQPTPLGNEVKDGFFAQQPKESQVQPPTSDARAPSPAPSVESTTSTSSRLRDAVLDATRRMSQIDLGSSTRPSVQRDLSHASAASIESTDSTATVVPRSPQQHRTITFSPVFPNQSFAALQQQEYPRAYMPPNLRTQTAFDIHGRPAAATHHSGSRTLDSSPAVTPGLFDPSPIRSTSGTPILDSAYPSPYLHHLHTQVPKDTHVADIDVDPISGRKIINDYEIIDELGRGTHGKVKLGRSLISGTYVAIKIVERFPKKRRLGRLGNAEDKVKREIAILKKARHPHIVALLEVIDDPTRRKVYIVLERVDMGEIPWRTGAVKDIAVVEERRYERESQGIFDDEEAEEVDQAVLDLGRVRRGRWARDRFKRLREERKQRKGDETAWSLELAGEFDDDSELDSSSRSSSTAGIQSSPEMDRILNKAPEPVARSESTDLLATVTPANAQAANPDIFAINDTRELDLKNLPYPDRRRSSTRQDRQLRDALEGTMYGAFDDISSPPEESSNPVDDNHSGDDSEEEDDPPLTFPEDLKVNIQGLTRNLSHGNLLQRAADLLDTDIHPDLSFVPCMTFQAIRECFRDTVLGLQYLHFQGIIHRDIKPPNLLFTQDHRTKISDFGVSYLGKAGEIARAAEGDETSEAEPDFDEAKELAKNVGTAAFYAPELCFNDPDDDVAPIGKAIDVWALGITLFCVIYARVPFVDNEYIVMRRIAEEEVYLPNKRLRPTLHKPNSRTPSAERQIIINRDYRAPTALEYEEVPADLIHLLRRLLDKDARTRMTLEEVRNDPWVTADLSPDAEWFTLSAPNSQTQGGKIEISREDVETSVVPLTFIDRMRSNIKKAIGSVGLGRSTSTKRRNVSQDGSGASASSSSTNMHQGEKRRPSLKDGSAVIDAIKASRDQEHPLSKSLAVSPVSTPHQQRVANTTSLGTPRMERQSVSLKPSKFKEELKPMTSTMSTAGSTRTIRPNDNDNTGYFDPSPPKSPSMPEPSESSMAALLGGATKLLKSVRDRSRSRGQDDAPTEIGGYASSDTGDAHGEPSLAVSTASALGHLDPPKALQDITPASSKQVSAAASGHSSLVSTPDFAVRQTGFDSFKVPQAPASASKRLSSSMAGEKPPTPQTRPGSRLANESTDEDFGRADDALLRRHIAETLRIRQRPSISSNMANDELSCPPSPDDDTYRRTRTNKPTGNSLDSIPPSLAPSLETGPTSPSSSVMPLMTPVSSEDPIVRPTPATSSPSLPSVDDELHRDEHNSFYSDRSAETERNVKSPTEGAIAVPPTTVPRLHHEDEGYDPDGDAAVESDEDADSSDEEGGGLVMMRRSVAARPPARSVSVSNAQITRHRERRETGSIVKKAGRTGSGGTGKKLPGTLRTESEPDERRASKGSASMEE